MRTIKNDLWGRGKKDEQMEVGKKQTKVQSNEEKKNKKKATLKIQQ